MGVKRPAEDDSEEGTSKAKVANLKKLEEEAKQHEKDNPQQGTSRQMQGQSKESGFHSIDSDDEEEYEKSKKIEALDVDEDVEGVEDSTIDRDGEIAITAFNLKDEEEDGHFGKDGSFVWKKKDEVRDSWLDGVDWGKVKEVDKERKEKMEREDEAEEEAAAAYDETDCIRQMVALMRPKENVAKALRRLGGGKKTSAQRLKEKKRIKEGKETLEEKSNREDMAKLTGLSDSVLTRSGHMEVYEETFESLTFKLKKIDEKKAAENEKPEIPEGTDDDDALDMLAGSMETDEGPKEENPEEEEEEEAAQEKKKGKGESAFDVDSEVQWEFRWENRDDAEVHGPHPTSEMIKWQENGFFDKAVYVRKVASGDFYDVKRVDFDLYT